jgi:flagellar motility protein MotE (MotC chaperone)
LAISGAAASILCAEAVASRAAAQQKWEPVVTTTASAEVAERVAMSGAQRVAQGTDQVSKFAAPALMAAQYAPFPGEDWSPIITGALGGQGSEGSAEPAAQPPVEQPEPPAKATAPAPGPAPAQAQPAAAPQAPVGDAKPAPRPQAAPPATAAGSAEPAAKPPPAAASPQPLSKPLEALSPDANPAQQYCYNIADPAADARVAWQAKKIAEMEGELDKRVVELDAKTEELKTWLARRDEFSRKAAEKLVGFYTRMRPDAAALQLAVMDEETAAAVLTKLEPKVASAVMGEMETTRAARLASIISGAAKVPPVQPSKAAAGGAAGKPSGEGPAAPPPARSKS